MNGIHDLGGMQGFGNIEIEQDEPLFRAEWEKRVFSLLVGLAPHGFFNIDEFRHGVERMGAANYLTTTYYEHWLSSFERLLTECGAITSAEYEQRCREIAEGMQ